MDSTNLKELLTVRPLAEWHEDHGPVLWWTFPQSEAPYLGTPLDLGQTVEVGMRAHGLDKLMRASVGGWPGYHTHWSPIPSVVTPSNVITFADRI